jgi:hypothetical protein
MQLTPVPAVKKLVVVARAALPVQHVCICAQLTGRTASSHCISTDTVDTIFQGKSQSDMRSMHSVSAIKLSSWRSLADIASDASTMASRHLAQARMRFHGQRSAPCRNGASRRFCFCIEQHSDPASMNDFTTALDDVTPRQSARVRVAFKLVWLCGHNASISLLPVTLEAVKLIRR